MNSGNRKMGCTGSLCSTRVFVSYFYRCEHAAAFATCCSLSHLLLMYKTERHRKHFTASSSSHKFLSVWKYPHHISMQICCRNSEKQTDKHHRTCKNLSDLREGLELREYTGTVLSFHYWNFKQLYIHIWIQQFYYQAEHMYVVVSRSFQCWISHYLKQI